MGDAPLSVFRKIPPWSGSQVSEEPVPWLCGWSLSGQEPRHWLWQFGLHGLPLVQPGCCTHLGSSDFSGCLFTISGKGYSSCLMDLDVKCLLLSNMWPGSLSSRSGDQNIDLLRTNPAVGALLGSKGPEKKDHPCFEELSVWGGGRHELVISRQCAGLSGEEGEFP